MSDQSLAQPRLLVDRREAARLLSLCERTAITLTDAGELPTVALSATCPASTICWTCRETVRCMMSCDTPNLFTPEEHDGNRKWIDHAVDVLHRLAQTRDDFTADELWTNVDDLPTENRAAGPAFVRDSKLAYIEPTTNVVNSSRSSCHHRPIRVWRSLLRGGAA